MGVSNSSTRCSASLVSRPPPAFFEFMKKNGQTIKAGDKAGDEASVLQYL